MTDLSILGEKRQLTQRIPFNVDFAIKSIGNQRGHFSLFQVDFQFTLWVNGFRR